MNLYDDLWESWNNLFGVNDFIKVDEELWGNLSVSGIWFIGYTRKAKMAFLITIEDYLKFPTCGNGECFHNFVDYIGMNL